MTGFERNENYKALAAAIIRQALNDYKEALARLNRNPHCRESRKEVAELDEFFHSEYYRELLGFVRPQ